MIDAKKHKAVFVMMTIVLMITISYFSTDQIQIAIYKFAITSGAAILGYWIDYMMFSRYRPGEFKREMLGAENGERFAILISAMQIRRALIILAITVSVSLGL